MPPRRNDVRFHHVPEKGQIRTQNVHTHSMAKASRTQAHRRPSTINRDKGTTAGGPVWLIVTDSQSVIDVVFGGVTTTVDWGGSKPI
ncbi:hypothetical protein T265_10358 [Opisthorchis viverrini]|uniref:Uncharacterized protein n=1 Tax=Opisthorchis viverrini TaxID=6198 RepID=A0A074Z2S1_OPIVI|nr:hypothetical protein T265_10358 [Opisthorchis viverrini]KER21273.1 hypothetical protein T265_10358 [Opisthorchis viverrini]